MKHSTQIILAVAFIGTLGLGGLVKTVYARQPQSQVAIMPQHHSSNQVAQVRDRKVAQRATEEKGDRFYRNCRTWSTERISPCRSREPTGYLDE